MRGTRSPGCIWASSRNPVRAVELAEPRNDDDVRSAGLESLPGTNIYERSQGNRP